MMGATESWPVRIGAVGDVAVSPGTVVWRVRGADEIRVSVIVKATLAIVPEGEMTLREPDPLVLHDAHHHADSQCSLRVASDLAPYLGQAELLVTGHAYAPPERPTPMAGARVVVHRGGQVLVSKTISVQGERRIEHGALGEPVPWQRMPLIYERAVHHPELNPVGVHPSRGAPNLIHSGDPSLPGCFGPLARRWPARLRLLGGLDPRQFDGARLEFPEGFAWEHLQASPPDQRLDFLQGTEGILLGGMHPTLPMVRSRLPGIQAAACVYPDRDGAGERLPLWADTLIIDTDRQTCSILWRGNFGVADEALLRPMRIRAGVSLPSAPLVFPGEAGGFGRAPMASIPEVPMVQPEVHELAPVSASAAAEPAPAGEPPAEEDIEEIPADEIVEELPDDALMTAEGTSEGAAEEIVDLPDEAVMTAEATRGGMAQPAGGWPQQGEAQPAAGWHQQRGAYPAAAWPQHGEAQPAAAWPQHGEAQPAAAWPQHGEAQPAAAWPQHGEAQPAAAWPQQRASSPDVAWLQHAAARPSGAWSQQGAASPVAAWPQQAAPIPVNQADEDEDAIITRGSGFRSPLAAPPPAEPAPAPPAPPAPPAEPAAADDEDAVITRGGGHGSGGGA